MPRFSTLSRKRISDAARIRGKRGAAALEAKRAEYVETHGIDAETLRWRALEDRRGTVWRTWTRREAGVEQSWQAVHSVAGRSDQFDVFCDGLFVRTAGLHGRNGVLRLFAEGV